MFTPDGEAYSSLLSSALAVIRIIQKSTDCPSSSKAHLWLDLCSRYRQISHKPWQPRKLRGEISLGVAQHTHATASAGNPFLTSMKTKPRLSGHSICFSSKGWLDKTTGEWNCHTIKCKKAIFLLTRCRRFHICANKTQYPLRKDIFWPKNSKGTAYLMVMC